MSKNVLLCVTGGIAVYKACSLVRELKKRHYNVQVIMTDHATQFVAPLTFATLSENKVVVNMFDQNNELHVGHITLAKQADVAIVYPATANVMAKLAHGIADDMVSATLLAITCPLVVCPAMNTNMYNNVATQENIATLARRGAYIWEGTSGQLACGDVGKGRVAEPQIVADRVDELFCKSTALKGKRVLVTVGATAEKLDDVRVITNNSSGKMGFEICKQALNMGAEVTAIVARHTASVPQGINVINVESTDDMLSAVMSNKDNNDIFIMCAAPADYRPKEVATSKLKADKLNIELVKNPDISATLGKDKGDKILVVFSAETDNGVANAKQKLVKKNANFAVLNIVKGGQVFGQDNNTVTIIDKNSVTEHQELPKSQVAQLILQKVVTLL